ncbi:MAG: bifunctional UDP-N-acetylglucosamine diphosphorylase/glucosamine-1-phosphate N-acetyltransferase GlmU [Gammaproteobacteria bacterium]|nr:bifunctional UDP-N-acetylglucosamine diphosphorylase/glucosamine-1-phosphate N-acetyltransferase GlmU [Gammaproteobacteria bacterium]
MSLSVVILAAGKGTRMKSSQPKVLHELAGKSLLAHVYDTAKGLGADEVVIVYGHGGDQVKVACKSFDASWVEQKQQLGTGHAVQQAMEAVNPANDVLVLYGDVPLTTRGSLLQLIEDFDNKIALMTVVLDRPSGYGRIIRDQHDKVTAIVEQKDASDEQKLINEVNTGILAAHASVLNNLLSKIDNNNSQKEYYLTDIFALAASQGIEIITSHPSHAYEVEGINNRQQLATLERIHQYNIASQLMENGVTLADPSRLDIRGEVEIDNDVSIDINVILQGKVKIAKGSHIGANSIIIDSTIGENVMIKPNCVIENSVIADHVDIGPFARLRPDTVLNENSRVGNFVEIKKSTIGKGSKVNHLSYIGDTEMGDHVNIGAGTITCNYDGANKHKTIIGDNVFVGSNSQLVAPVQLGKAATIAAGATITKDVEDGSLAISRSPQKSIKNWQRPTKK